MTYDVDQLLSSVLHLVSAPTTDDNLLGLRGWHACEVGAQPAALWARFNPLDTTLWQPGCSNYNTFGPGGAYHVRNYPDLPTGARATALTIENGFYPHALIALHRGQLAAVIEQGGPILHEIDLWGTGGAHVQAWLRAHAQRASTPAPPAHPHATYVVRPGDTLSAIAARYHLRGGWQELYQVNRHVIGSDPNMIRAGERLVIG